MLLTKLEISVTRCQACKIRPLGYFSSLLSWLLSALCWPNTAVIQLFTFSPWRFHTLPHSSTLSPSLSPSLSSSIVSGKSFLIPLIRADNANQFRVPVWFLVHTSFLQYILSSLYKGLFVFYVPPTFNIALSMTLELSNYLLKGGKKRMNEGREGRRMFFALSRRKESTDVLKKKDCYSLDNFF